MTPMNKLLSFMKAAQSSGRMTESLDFWINVIQNVYLKMENEYINKIKKNE